VPSLAQNIRLLRKRLGLRQREFAEKLGVSTNTVSQYETELVKPGDGMLLRLQRLARGTPEEAFFKTVLYARMDPSAEPSRPVEEYLREYDQYKKMLERQGFPVDITPANAKQVLAKEISIILTDEDLARPLITDVVRYWRILGKDPQAQVVFADLVKYLEVHLVALRESAGRKTPLSPRKSPGERDP
jgi:transcriptional regulator with XRE-family HTH domain